MIQIDMPMPNNCVECRFNVSEFGYCNAMPVEFVGQVSDFEEDGKPEWCPLKAQEPRVMTYDELATFDGAFLIESSAISQLDWVFFFDTDTKSDAIWVEGFDGERYVVYREDYGTYTRCWTSRPDEKRRDETPWE